MAPLVKLNRQIYLIIISSSLPIQHLHVYLNDEFFATNISDLSSTTSMLHSFYKKAKQNNVYYFCNIPIILWFLIF